MTTSGARSPGRTAWRRGGPACGACSWRTATARAATASWCAGSASAARLPLGPAELPVAHRHHRVQAALRQEGLPVGHQGLLRLLGRGVEGRREPGRRARQLDARGRLRAARARRGPRHPLRPRRALPLARLDLDLRGARPHQEHVGQGLQPGQRGDGGLLRPAQEGALARQGLGGLGPRPLHRGARWLDRPLQYGEAQRCARRPHAGRVPRRAGKGRVTVQEIVRSSPSPGLKREIIHSHSHQGSQPLTRPPRAGPTS